MRQSSGKKAGATRKRRVGEQARVQIALLAVVCLLACVGIGAVLFFRTTGRREVKESEEKPRQERVVLSPGTQAVLRRLNTTVEIRFYALLDQAGGPDSLQTLAARVDQLLSAYQQASAGKIKVVRYNSRSDLKTEAAAAAADGIKPFNLDTGDAGYLGLAVLHQGQKESFPQLFPEWEQALESDLSRAIARLIDAPSPAGVSQIDPAVTAEVQRQIPNFASVSVEEGARILRESAIKDFQAMAGEMETQIRQAEQRVKQAQDGKSEAELQAALKQLQQVRADQTAKLREITAKSTAQIEALRQLKGAAQ